LESIRSTITNSKTNIHYPSILIMTIKIEREAMLSVVNSQQHPSSESPSYCYPLSVLSSRSGSDCCRPSSHDEPSKSSVFFELTSKQHGELRCQSPPPPELDDTDDESTIDSWTVAKGVTFADPLVTEVRTRPRTLKKNVRSLFYTYEETQR